MDKISVEVHGKNGAWYTVMSFVFIVKGENHLGKVKFPRKSMHFEHILIENIPDRRRNMKMTFPLSESMFNEN